MIEGLLVVAGFAAGATCAFFFLARTRVLILLGAELYRCGVLKMTPQSKPHQAVLPIPDDLDAAQSAELARIAKREREIRQLRQARTNGVTGKLEPVDRSDDE